MCILFIKAVVVHLCIPLVLFCSDDPDGKEEIASLPGQSRLVHIYMVVYLTTEHQRTSVLKFTLSIDILARVNNSRGETTIINS